MARLKVPTGSCSVLAFSSHPSCLWQSFVFPSAKLCSQPRVEKWKKSNLPPLYPFHANCPIFWNFIHMHQRPLCWQGIKSREKLSDCSKGPIRWGIMRKEGFVFEGDESSRKGHDQKWQASQVCDVSDQRDWSPVQTCRGELRWMGLCLSCCAQPLRKGLTF